MLSLVLLLVGSQPLPEPRSMDRKVEQQLPHDPAGVEGRWSYSTKSNCGSGVRGKGALELTWDPERQVYFERGYVFWPDSGMRFEWWGENRYDTDGRVLVGTLRNSIGDDVEARWRVHDKRLVDKWEQANGCRGEGVATKRTQLPACTTARDFNRLCELADTYVTLRATWTSIEPSERCVRTRGSERVPTLPCLLEAWQESLCSENAREALAAMRATPQAAASVAQDRATRYGLRGWSCDQLASM